MEELKNCPQCGGEVRVYLDDSSDYKGQWEYYIDCDCEKYFKTKEEAIKAWNHRTPSSSNGLNEDKVMNILMEIDNFYPSKHDYTFDCACRYCLSARAICQEFKQTSVPETMGGFPIDNSGVNPLAKQTSGLERISERELLLLWNSDRTMDILKFIGLVVNKFGVPAVPSVEEIEDIIIKTWSESSMNNASNMTKAIRKLILKKGG